MQKIIIKNFGPITDAEIEIKKLNLFIGNQATGKSTIAKLVYFFKTIKLQLSEIDFFTDNISSFIKKIENQFNIKFSAFKNKNFSIKFKYNNQKFIEIKFKNGVLTTILSENLEKKIKEFIQNNNSKIEQIDDVFSDYNTTIFIPASRSIAIQISNSISKIDENYDKITNDIYVNEFIRQVFINKDEINNILNTNTDDNFSLKIREYIESIIKGNYKKNGDEELFYYDNQNKISINNLSSGQMETIWLCLLLYKYSFEKKDYFIIVEEPEANLFPTTQYEISKLISMIYNIYNISFFVTTHSPFILNSFNNMILAYEKGINKTEVANIIDKYLWLNTLNISAYSLDEVCNNIIDSEYNQIDTNVINSISFSLNDEFNKLLEY